VQWRDDVYLMARDTPSNVHQLTSKGLSILDLLDGRDTHIEDTSLKTKLEETPEPPETPKPIISHGMSSQAGLSMVIIDGCRLYPEDLGWRGAWQFPPKPVWPGAPPALKMRLTPSSVTELIAFACGPREAAEDMLVEGETNGLYTKHLLSQVASLDTYRTQGVKDGTQKDTISTTPCLAGILDQVAIDVKHESDGKQTPWVHLVRSGTRVH